MQSVFVYLAVFILYEVIAEPHVDHPSHHAGRLEFGNHGHHDNRRRPFINHDHSHVQHDRDLLMGSGHENRGSTEARGCPTYCPFTFHPVCASNGQTYSNTCSMRVAACRMGRRLYVRYFGRC